MTDEMFRIFCEVLKERWLTLQRCGWCFWWSLQTIVWNTRAGERVACKALTLKTWVPHLSMVTPSPCIWKLSVVVWTSNPSARDVVARRSTNMLTNQLSIINTFQAIEMKCLRWREGEHVRNHPWSVLWPPQAHVSHVYTQTLKHVYTRPRAYTHAFTQEHQMNHIELHHSTWVLYTFKFL